MSKFAILSVLFFSIIAFANTNKPKAVINITTQFKTTMIDCPEKIWNNYDWKMLKVAFLYPSLSHSWIWDASSNTIEEVDNKVLPTSALGSLYEFFEFSPGQPTMSLNMEENYNHLFELGVHEFFHYQGQKNWQYGDAGGGRGTAYPLEWQPRLIRRMIFENLKKYFISNNENDLNKARYWFEKWKTEYSDESKSTTDGYEGTAEYSEKMASAVSELGCSANDHQLKMHIIKQVQANYGSSVGGKNLALDSEGYEIGSLASFILRFQNRDLSAWNNQVSQGKTPLEILFENGKSEPEIAPSSLINHFQLSAQKINQERGQILDIVITNLTNKNFIRVSAPSKWLQSNLMPKFFATSGQINFYPLFTNHRYLSPNGMSDFILKTDAVIFDQYTALCPDQDAYTLVPATSVHFTKGVAQISAPSVIGTLKGQLKVDSQGFQYICTQ